MHTSRFQLGLIATLSVGLGLALSSPMAIGYPAGSAVSYGANPVWSAGGVINGDGGVVLLSAPSDQALVVTDINLSVTSTNSGCTTALSVGIGDGSATSVGTSDLGQFGLGVNREGYSYTQYHPIYSTQLGSGAKVAPGDNLQLFSDVLWNNYCSLSEVSLNYMISGYYAQP